MIEQGKWSGPAAVFLCAKPAGLPVARARLAAARAGVRARPVRLCGAAARPVTGSAARTAPRRPAMVLALLAALVLPQSALAADEVPVEAAMGLCRHTEGGIEDLLSRLTSGGWRQATDRPEDTAELGLLQSFHDGVASGRLRAGKTPAENEAALAAMAERNASTLPHLRRETSLKRGGTWMQIDQAPTRNVPAVTDPVKPPLEIVACIFAGPEVAEAAAAAFGPPQRELPARGLPFTVTIIEVTGTDARESIYSFHPLAGAFGSMEPPVIAHVPRLRGKVAQ